MFRTILSSAALTLSFALGTVVASPPEVVKDIKRNVRELAGLPKFWMPHVVDAPVTTHVEVACPPAADTLAVVTGGQSNAANSVSRQTVTRTGKVFLWFAGRCYSGRDPALGATGARGSLWIDIGDRLAERTGKNILLINAAVGGTQAADWLDPRSGYLAALTDRVGAARRAGFEPTLAFWHQGETDAAASTPEAFEPAFRELMQRVTKLAPEARLYAFQATRCTGERRRNGVPAIAAAERRVAQSLPHLIAGMDTDTLGDDYRYDGCHFNSMARDTIARQVMQDLEPFLGGLKLASN